ncbi:hypothetical protein JQS43_09965 [Natronosporangium hydrolyticum]|uniref:Uncharacterized protein n=1 Tax=Natronosporangium hydrolyticum TaxID=2811111 RepID=A0A895YKQ4_9ACTN|nr:hypothetical protein [Natronosporangium hydrolyticum]QSB16565.1 hypothetical protein JQS43_09965 [Natronosporangium hydrolyticum]
MSAVTGTEAAPTRRGILHAGSLGMLVGGLITVIGSLLPWVMTPFGSLSGTDGPGLWTLSAGFIAIAGALLPWRRVVIGHCFVAGGGVALIVVWQVGRLLQLSAATDSWGQLLPGMGLVMAAGGAVILLRTGTRVLTKT